ncbi:MAG: glycosyltransferase family 2 protein [Deltaproteobacteria bacterium]|nr:glycosyltransferase family 2 protein [Deltaproteobacteria bacterium]
MPLLSILIVNYNSSALCRDLLLSLQADLSQMAGLDHETIIVDNASTPAEVSRLDKFTRNLGAVQTIFSPINLGYAGGINLGYQKSRGELILILNPDVFFFPGAITRLIESLTTLPRAGVVAPRTVWDRGGQLIYPPRQPQTLGSLIADALTQRFTWAEDLVQRRHLNQAVAFWRLTRPIKVRFVGGYCLLTTREVMDRVGLLDEGYTLYFEDADWLDRVVSAGYGIYYIPDATVVHYYNQSAKLASLEAREKFVVSAERYLIRRYGAWRFTWATRLVAAISADLHARPSQWGKIKELDLGPITSAPLLSLDNDPGLAPEYLLLVSPSSTLRPGAGVFLSQPEYLLDESVFAGLAAATYYAGLYGLPRLETLARWTWTKV